MTEPHDATGGITFDESMRGPFVLGATDPIDGAERGKDERSTLIMRATITIPDLGAFREDRDHNGTITGEVDFPPIGMHMKANRGVFRLFSTATTPRTKYMVYELAFEQGGKSYYLAGKKEVRDDPGIDVWSDTTTLYSRLHQGTDSTGPVIGAGILRLGVGDLAHLLSTMRPVGTHSATSGAKAVLDFGKFFAGELWQTYAKK
jgi:cholesterol oxidase